MEGVQAKIDGTVFATRRDNLWTDLVPTRACIFEDIYIYKHLIRFLFLSLSLSLSILDFAA
jgi:hypothetical protein